MSESIAVLTELARHPGYQYLPATSGWQSLSRPFFHRLYGTKQVTDAFLLGPAVEHNLILATLDKAILYLAGRDHSRYVLVLDAT